MSKKSDALLLEAQNENTPEKRLSEIWNTSRSVKVRKAVAGNSNAGPDVLRQAARLYIEEVVQNPGFEILTLFSADDQWITDIHSAYTSPEEFLLKKGLYFAARYGGSDYLKACLLSKNLTAKSLDQITEHISKEAFRRVLKGSGVKARLNHLVMSSSFEPNNCYNFSMTSLMNFFQEGVISLDDMNRLLRRFPVASSSAKKSYYVAFIKKLQKDYKDSLFTNDEPEQQKIIEALGRTFLASRSHAMSWVSNTLGSIYDAALSWKGPIVCRVYKYLKEIAGPKLREFMVRDNLKVLGTCIANYMRNHVLKEISPYSLSRVYELAKEYNLIGENFKSFGFSLPAKDTHQKVLCCNFEVQEFFVKSFILGDWTIASESEALYNVASRVNDETYARSGISSDLLFKSCSIKKIISFNSSSYLR